MMRQSLQQVWPRGGRGGLSPAATGRMASLQPGVATIGTRPAPPYGGRARGVVVWRQRAPQVLFRQRVAGWRARNWRRAVLAWFVLSLIIMAVAAEPKTDFPKAQASSVPAVRMILRVTGGLTAAGVPLLLIALP
jgi:hypothetical protein